jgi:DNA-binding MarR family transcriptional regulator
VTATEPPLPLEAAAEIRQGVLRLALFMRAGRSADALSGSKLGVLGHLRRNGPATAGELAAAVHQRPQSLTRVFAQLEADGLIARRRDHRDGRHSVLSVTRAGRTALARDMAERDTWLASALTGLSPTEQQLLQLAVGLLNQLADTPPPPAPRPRRPPREIP